MMYTKEDTIKLYDSNNNFLPDFDDKIDEIEKSLHGDHYYDTDEDLIDTRTLDKREVSEIKREMKKSENINKGSDEIQVKKIEEPKKSKVKFTDFLPVLFFILIFAIVIYGGYYFLNHVDISSVVNLK